MAVHVENFHIDSFRGIKAFDAQSLNHVNLIVGDNNCGKTSLLEALLMLRSPASVVNALRVARQREMAYAYNRASAFDSFLSLFPQYKKSSPEREIKLHAVYRGSPVTYHMYGEQTRILLDEQDVKQSVFANGRKYYEGEATAFKGQIDWAVDDNNYHETVRLHEYSKISGLELIRGSLIEMTYLSPIDHVKNNILNNIVKNDGYKDICLHVVRMFDPDIEDILILKNEQTNRPVEYIRHRILGNMPVSTYGDGIKKVLLLANAIVSSAGGMLLIDEIDTAIHAKYFNDIFHFLVAACARYEVQLFITTHNIEAVDAILATQYYSEQNDEDNISVITLKKGVDKTYTRILTGREVFENRESFGFEVRV